MADNNAKSAKPGGKPSTSAENTRQHYRMALGENVTGQKAAEGGKKTRA